jgi:hypothetical protein
LGNPYGGPGKKGRPPLPFGLRRSADAPYAAPLAVGTAPHAGGSAPPSQRLNRSEFCPSANKDFEPCFDGAHPLKVGRGFNPVAIKLGIGQRFEDLAVRVRPPPTPPFIEVDA